ncbi:MAG: helix-turn-helix domain-containing protein [Gemmatimonadota bacterium]|nr:helix-turn-helix domain-containing protein [Gemmatimonadota bacterium]
MATPSQSLESAAWAVGRLAGVTASAASAVVAALGRRHAIRATNTPASVAADLLLSPAPSVVQDAASHLSALRLFDEASGPLGDLIIAALERAGLTTELGEPATARLTNALAEGDTVQATIERAATVAGSVVAPAPASPSAQRAAALATALILARAGLVSAPWLAPTRLDAAARSAAVAAERSGLWDEWTIAWCTMLTSEATDISRALDAMHTRMQAERAAVREQPRVGATDTDVLTWLHSYSTFTIKEASSGLGLTPPTVGSAIERLEAAGYATELTGQRRDRIWTSAALLELAAGR